MAGDQYTLGFDFGKDWVRLRDVKRRQMRTEDSKKEALMTTHESPGTPWQPSDEAKGQYQLADYDSILLAHEPSDQRWHVTKDGQTIVKAESIERIELALHDWFATEIERLNDRIAFAKLELEAIELFDSESGAAKKQLSKLLDWKEKKLALFSIREVLPPQSIN